MNAKKLDPNIERFNAEFAGEYLGDEWVVRASDYDALEQSMRAQLEQERARVAELEKQEAVLQLSELMRGLEIGPGFASMPPYIFYVTGKHIADQAKQASDAATLRKQAEAVEGCAASIKDCSRKEFKRWVDPAIEHLEWYASGLRQRADEMDAETAGDL